jgi:hypothetical protein
MTIEKFYRRPMSEKEKIIERLNQILQVRDIHWNLLPDADLVRLTDAFERLRVDVEEIFGLLDEAPTLIQDKGEWKNYVV